MYKIAVFSFNVSSGLPTSARSHSPLWISDGCEAPPRSGFSSGVCTPHALVSTSLSALEKRPFQSLAHF